MLLFKFTKINIAIYSGAIPSTTFIERLIQGLSKENNYKIFLFGEIKKDVNYNENVIISGYSGRVNKFFRLLLFTLLLTLFRNKDKKKLDRWIINHRNRNKQLLKIKCYPVLWYKPDVFHLQWAKSIEDWIWVKEFGIKLIVSLRGGQINHQPISDFKVKQSYLNYFPLADGF